MTARATAERTAADFAPLVGRYVDLTRAATAEERAAGLPDTVGLAGVIATVQDVATGVVVMTDYGMGCTIEPGQQWSLAVSQPPVDPDRADPAALAPFRSLVRQWRQQSERMRGHAQTGADESRLACRLRHVDYGRRADELESAIRRAAGDLAVTPETSTPDS